MCRTSLSHALPGAFGSDCHPLCLRFCELDGVVSGGSRGGHGGFCAVAPTWFCGDHSHELWIHVHGPDWWLPLYPSRIVYGTNVAGAILQLVLVGCISGWSDGGSLTVSSIHECDTFWSMVSGVAPSLTRLLGPHYWKWYGKHPLMVEVTYLPWGAYLLRL